MTGSPAEGLEDLERLRLLVLRDLGDVVDGSRRDAGRVEPLDPARDLAARKTRLEDLDQLVPVGDALGVRGEALVLDEVGHLEHRRKLREEVVVGGEHHQLPVARREGLVRRDQWEGRPVPPGDRARAKVADQVVGDESERRLVQGNVDHPPLPRSVALPQRRQDPDRSPHARGLVDHRDADAHAGTVLLPRDADDPAGGLHERVVSGLDTVRPDVAERADRGVDEPRVPRSQLLGAEADLLGVSGTKALDDDVRAVGEPVEHLLPRVVVEVQRERPLARVGGEEDRAFSIHERRPPLARLVPTLRVLDLDHLGPERGQDLRAIRPRERVGEVEDAESRKRLERHTLTIWAPSSRAMSTSTP